MSFYNKKVKITQEIANQLAFDGFIFLANQPHFLAQFIELSGIQIENMQNFVQSAEFSQAILEFYLHHEKALQACAQSLDIEEEQFQYALNCLQPTHFS